MRINNKVDKKSSKFNISINEENPDSQFQEEIQDLRIKKLSSKITLTLILIPCLTGVILFTAFLDIKKRFDIIHDTEATKVQGLSKDLESRFSSLSVQYAKFEDSFAKKISSIKKTASSLTADLKEAKKEIKKINSSKTDKKEFTKTIDKIDKTLARISKDMKDSASEIKVIDEKFDNKLAKLVEAVDKTKIELNKLRTDISDLSSTKIDKKELDIVLKNKEKIYLQNLSRTTKNFNNKIESIEKKIKTTILSSSSVSKQVSVKKPASKVVVPESGDIIEQDLEE